jgi:hypothetical protein
MFGLISVAPEPRATMSSGADIVAGMDPWKGQHPSVLKFRLQNLQLLHRPSLAISPPIGSLCT